MGLVYLVEQIKRLSFSLLLLFSVNVYAETWSCTLKDPSSNDLTVFSRDGKSMKKINQYDKYELKNSKICKDVPYPPEVCKTGTIENSYKIHFENPSYIVINELETRKYAPTFKYIYMDKTTKQVLEQGSFIFDHSTNVYKCAITK